MTAETALRNVRDKVDADGITLVLNLFGTHGYTERDLVHYAAQARHRGVDRWVGAHAGSYERGGAYWTDGGVLMLRGLGRSPVPELAFRFSCVDAAGALLDACRQELLEVAWDGNPDGAVLVRLGDGT